MSMLPCDWCGKLGHPWFDCTDPKRPADWRPARLSEINIDRPTLGGPIPIDAKVGIARMRKITLAEAKEQFPPAPELAKPKRGRPSTGFDKKAYDRNKAAERRERERAAREGK